MYNSYVKMYDGIRELYKGLKRSNEIMSTLGGDPDERIKDLIDGLFSFAKFKECDRVELNRTPEITQEKSWGWMGSKHFLKKGARATVREVDWHAKEKTFLYALIFDDESWVDYENIIHPADQKALYYFRESYLIGSENEKA